MRCLYVAGVIGNAAQVAPVRSASQPQCLVGTWENLGPAQTAETILAGEAQWL